MATEVGTLQSKLTLDFTDFAEGMSAAIRLVRKFGSQLQGALGKTSTQGFLTMKNQADELRQSLVELQAAASSFQATMNNTNTHLRQFTGVKAFTSSMQQAMSQASTSVGNVGNQVTNLGTMAANSAANFSKISTNVSQTTTAASKLVQQVSSTATAATKASNAMKQTTNSTNKAARSAQNVSSATAAAAKNANNLNKNLKHVQNNLKKSSVRASELGHIISGIVISQSFYAILNTMEELVTGSINFMHNMAQAQIAFKYLVGSGQEAAAFIRELQDFAVLSPLSTEAAMASARQLMAMGFQAQSVKSVLGVLTDTASVFTSSSADMVNMIDHITLAIGQMKSSGTVMMQELRQLYNAGIPVFDILQKELGLTAEQVQNIGNESIDSTTAVIALLKGLQERYGGAAKEFTRTIPGAMSAMRDSISITAQELFKVPYDAVTNKINNMATAVNNLAIITRAYGAGGFFQAIFPKDIQPQMRNVLGSLMQFGKALKAVGSMVKEVFGAMGKIFVTVLSIVLPPLTTLTNLLAQLAKVLLDTVPAIKYVIAALALFVICKVIGALIVGLWKKILLGKICTMVAGAVTTLVTALKNLALWSIASKKNFVIFALSTGLLVLLASSERVRESLKKLMNTFQNMSKVLSPELDIGYDPKDIAQPEFKEADKDAQKYDGTLADVAGQMQDVGKAAEDVSKKIKNSFNQSFDEVYGIKPTTADDLGLSAIADVDLSDILSQLEDLNTTMDETGFSGDFWEDWEGLQEIELPDLDLDWKGFWNGLVGDMGTGEIVTTGIILALGAAIGAVAGSAKIGLAITALALWLTDLFWPEISKAFNLDTKEDAYAIIIATQIAGLIGKVTKLGTSKTLILGAITALATWVNMQLTKFLEENDSAWDNTDSIALEWGGVIAAIIGGIALGPAGALIGFAVYDLVYWIVNKLREQLVDKGLISADMFDFSAIGAALGAGIGLIVGGPAGAAIGAGIGILVGNIVGAISDAIKEIDGDWDLVPDALKLWGNDIGKAFIDAWKEVGTWIDGFWQPFKDAWARVFDGEDLEHIGMDIMDGIIAGIDLVLGTIGSVVVGIFKSLWDAFCAIFGIASPAKEMYVIGENILLGVWEGLKGAVGTLIEGIVGLAGGIKDALTSWFSGVAEDVGTWASNTYSSITGWVSDVGTSIGDWASSAKESVTTWATDTATSIGTWVTDTATSIGTWVTDTAESVGTWATGVKESVKGFAESAGSKIKGFVTGAGNNINSWANTAGTKISTWASTAKSKVSDFAKTAGTNIGTFVSNAKTKITGWVTSVTTSIGNWATNVKTDVADAAKTAKTKIGDWIDTTKSNISKWTSSTWSSVTTWCKDVKDAFADWASGVWKSVKEGIGGAIDKVKEFFGLSSKNGTIDIKTTTPTYAGTGHATGGVFNREHWARFAEGNKREAIIPLENDSAMQPFSDAVSNAVIAALGPMVASMKSSGNDNNLRPLYVGTLIADERSLKELQRKMNVIEISEKDRRG